MKHGFARFLATAAMASGMPSGSPSAAFPFSDRTETDLGRRLAVIAEGIVREKVAALEGFILVESRQTQAILETMELQLSGAYDQGKAAAVGELIGARYLCFGEITDELGGYRLTLRVVGLSTGAVVIEKGARFRMDGASSRAARPREPRRARGSPRRAASRIDTT